MRRNNFRTYFFSLRKSLPLAALLLCANSAQSLAQSIFIAKPSYTVNSSSPKEVIITVHPEYEITNVTDEKTGAHYENITFSGSSLKGFAIGSPATGWIPIDLLAPSKDLASFEIIKTDFEPVRNATLAPVPKWTFAHDEFKSPQVHYIANAASYSSSTTDIASIGSPNIYRTAYSQELRINPIQFDAGSNTIKLVKELTVRITFANISTAPDPHLSSLTPQEAELFQSLFANGNTYQFYHSATDVVTKALNTAAISYKKSASAQSGEQWLLVNTSEQGVYHITASQLSQSGISNVDASTLQLFGYGGQALPEDIDATTGELRECAIDIIKNSDGSFNEVRFYEPGLNEWHFDPSPGDPLYRLYHILNPFSISGHYLLKSGGNSSSKRIAFVPLNILLTVQQNSVPTVAIHEEEDRFENPNISREFVGEDIPKDRTVNVGLPDLPGYTSDSTILRPGFNSRDNDKHTFNLSVNGTALNPIIDENTVAFDLDQFSTRNWNQAILAGDLLRSQNNSITLSATSSNADSKFWLDWVEIFYRRQASLANGQIPFYVLADGRGLNYNFTEAANGETWDVTDASNPVKIASASGNTMSVPVQGNAKGFQQFVAFNLASLKNPTLTTVGVLPLRNGVCQTGAAEIIVTPAAYIDQANKLAKQRTMGGQATGPISVAVVTVEDINKEFGYGSPDYTAIRNFMSYMFRHTTANNSTKPLYLTLFANGHCDYRNKTTSLPIGVPIYEQWNSTFSGDIRNGEPPYFPNDAYFVNLTRGSNKMDVAVGRITVHNIDEADAFVSKVIKYETSSDEGDWRARTTLICDDRHWPDGGADPLQHIYDTENEMNKIPTRIILHDVFGQAYADVITSAGRRKPEMEKAIIDAFNSGSALISWVGHGNPAVWAHENVLTVPATINKLTNFNRLAYLTTATCDFSRFDDYSKPISGGVQLITKADGGVVGSLGTSRSVSPDQTAPTFYQALLSVGCNELIGSTPVGVAFIAARSASGEGPLYYIMGDAAQRVIFPRQYVTVDSINGIAFNESDAPRTIAALSQLTISGHISNSCDGSDLDANFNGNAAVTLFDAPTQVSATSTFVDAAPITDKWSIDGPILYHGSSTVTAGKFRASFIVSKDIKFDSSRAKISMLAYSDNFHSALGVTKNVVVYGIDTARASSDHTGPKLVPYIGSRAFKSGDVVPVNSKIIVDVEDISGLNSSTASIGHSFVAWTDDLTLGEIDLASTYVSQKDNYKIGTSEQQAVLPVGTHILKVRAFDALNNPTFAEVEFTARDVQPYSLYNTTITPNPVTNDHSVFTFLQPSAPESPVDVTITIYSVIGQKLRQLTAEGISQNSVSIPFDGRADGGTPLANGVYVYRVTANERLSGIQTNVGGTFVVVRQ